jgi:hypothetical protein
VAVPLQEGAARRTDDTVSNNRKMHGGITSRIRSGMVFFEQAPGGYCSGAPKKRSALALTKKQRATFALSGQPELRGGRRR